MLKLPSFATTARRLAPAGGAATILVLAGALAGTGSPAAAAARTAAGAGAAAGVTAVPHRQAYDPVTGKDVTVYQPTNSSTPVHPEKLTHPQNDDMGAINSRHGMQQSAAPRTAMAAAAATRLPGIDVSSHQGNINWASVAPYVDFVYAKATEGTYYRNPYFTNQYQGPYNHGRIRGAYHFAIPNNSRGAVQADYFVNHGGRWSRDGKTLPGALDIEYNPYGGECYGFNRSQMRTWIGAFVNRYAYDTGVFPVIYTTYGWWSYCTGNATGFHNYDPLWVARYASSAGTLPGGYRYYTFWQHAASGWLPGDQDYFNGAYTRLQALTRG